ncbi:formate dehydrogenase accessory sulfurtransferase FdhD [Duganella sp. FT92W]|uniref:Sulfur carrier protein FdhD n=1 Tax=Pseudoduganella rivuli TaxID=2666085 RepID=A0A7X2LRW6_9BURK|nr:formate dehydrogenase accessory sulfurtransferase FdhD [Pseudoduganella rivuli]MRV70352.1 formate dehydrogenase accessory sulfurtransferase FdhD [Pseudoduganella rivuli]
MHADQSFQHPGHRPCAITRHRGGETLGALDNVAEEVPVALVFNGISHAVMMATPRDLEPLAVGFALTEGIVASAADIYDMEVHMLPAAAEVQLTISRQAFMQLKERRRSLAGRTGCGVCGIESLALLDLDPEPMPAAPLPESLAPAIARAAQELPRRQALMRATGGVHAAAWCGLDGAVHAVFEDVGRHNAMDKLVGSLALDGVDLRNGFVFLSSRASYELVRKAARVGIPMLATISAPTSLAIDIAGKAGLTLASFCRQDGFTVYTDVRPDRAPRAQRTAPRS